MSLRRSGRTSSLIVACMVVAGILGAVESSAHSGAHMVYGATLDQSGKWKGLALVWDPTRNKRQAVGIFKSSRVTIKLSCIGEQYTAAKVHVAYFRGRAGDGKTWYLQAADTGLLGVVPGSDHIQITDVPGTLPCGYSSISSPNRGILYGPVHFAKL